MKSPILTGKTRYRNTFFGRLILQVEEIIYKDCMYSFDTYHFKRWRDAKATDLLEIKL